MTMPPRLRLTLLASLAALALCATPAAFASGDGGSPTDELVSHGDTDFSHDDVLHGDLGILLPTWNEAALYLAWRAIVSDGKLPHWAAHAGTARGDVPAGWMDVANTAASTPGDGTTLPDILPSTGSGLNCSADTHDFAVRTLRAIQARPDKSPARVDAWIDAQNRVFALCARDPLDVLDDADPQFAPPPPLPASEPLFWRQLRDYQLAAMAFHGAHYEQSQQAFERIGRTPGHPMQVWGGYLALRSHLRALQLPVAPLVQTNAAGPTPAPQEQLAALEALRREGAAILRDPALAEAHDATAATLRRAAFLLAPGHRFAELTAMLDDTRTDPLRDDTLDDWSLMGYGTGDEKADARAFAALRAAHPWYDWLASVTRDSVARPPSANAKPAPCAAACLRRRPGRAASHRSPAIPPTPMRRCIAPGWWRR